MTSVVPGGQAFVNKFVEDACRWTQFVKEPIFIVQTQWYTTDTGDIYRSMGLQWQPEKQRWAVISAPVRIVPLSQVSSGSATDSGGKRVACFNKDDPKRLCYYVNSDDDLLEMLQATFELELWTSGQEIRGQDIYFECEPKLFTVYHTGQLKRVFCNIHTFAESISAWEEMCRQYLKIIKILTGKTNHTTAISAPKTKRQKINIDE